MVSARANHCNNRKLAAKGAQDASQKLYLCLMLRARPATTFAVVHSLGQRFLGVFLPEFGFEVRRDGNTWNRAPVPYLRQIRNKKPYID